MTGRGYVLAGYTDTGEELWDVDVLDAEELAELYRARGIRWGGQERDDG